MFKKLYVLLFIATYISCQSPTTDDSLTDYLATRSGVTILSHQLDSTDTQIVKLMVMQPIDHFSPTTDSFQQYVVLKHKSAKKHLVYETEGYILSHYFKPLADSLQANQLIVEHRFEGKSVPDSINWNFLTVKQAAADFHRVAMLFKPYYQKSWVSAGFSKGGQTALFYRKFYPDDVQATICFDAPLNFEQQDKRIDTFFETVSSPACRQKLIAVQRTILKNKENMLVLLEKYCQREGFTYDSLGLTGLLEYTVLEYPFSFWQYSDFVCEEIPSPGASSGELFNHLVEVVGLKWLADQGFNSPAMYQFHTELGYYGYVTKNVANLLSVAPKNANNLQFSPQNWSIQFDSTTMKDINQWVQNQGNNIIFIYGSLDPWSATQVQLTGKTNALKIIENDGNHLTMLHNLSTENREKIMKTLRKWLE